jgi:hypothetical protein
MVSVFMQENEDGRFAAGPQLSMNPHAAAAARVRRCKR